MITAVKTSILVSAFTLMATIWCSPAFSDNTTISIAANDFPPLSGPPEKNGGLPGFQVEILKYSMARIGYSVSISYVPFKRILSMIQNRAVDGVLCVEPKQTPGWVHPRFSTAPNQTYLVSLAGSSFTYHGLSSLYEVRLGAVAGYGYADKEIDNYLETTGRSSKSGLIYGDDADWRLIRMLIDGRFDVIATSDFPFHYFLKRNGLNPADFKIVNKMGVFHNVVAFNPGLPNAVELAKASDEGYQELRRSGKLKEILAKYGVSVWNDDIAHLP